MRPGEATLRDLLAPDIAPHLAHPATEEVVVNKPGEVGVEQNGRWSYHSAPSLTFDNLRAIVHLASYLRGKDVGVASKWQTSTTLPDGERLKGVFPPVAAPRTVTLSIRKRAATFTPTFAWLDGHGYFSALDPAVRWPAYFQALVDRRWTGVVSGDIGSSKTTFGEALVRAGSDEERHITVERSEEWSRLPFRNLVQYYFEDGDQNSAAMVIQNVMQGRPDRCHFQELQGPEAYYWKRLLKIGVPGVTTVHSLTGGLALGAIATMQQQNESGRGIPTAELIAEMRLYVRFVVHVQRFLPEAPGEKKLYRAVEVIELGATEAEDRVVSKATPESIEASLAAFDPARAARSREKAPPPASPEIASARKPRARRAKPVVSP